MNVLKVSFVELNARERVKAILDEGTFRELLDPFDGFESPHLERQNIVPQSDDGVVVAKGKVAQEPAVVISIEGNFQGGGIGEVSGAKIAGALELALRDNKEGIPTRPILLYDTGGVRLQEANYGLLAIAEISAAIVALREYVPVIGVIPGKIGCFGGMSLTAGLCSTLIMTKEGRLTLNGPEVIEQEAGIEEFDSQDRRLIWNTIGGEQRYSLGFIDHLVDDNVETLKEIIRDHLDHNDTHCFRSEQVDLFRSRLQKIDPSQPFSHKDVQKVWNETIGKETSNKESGSSEGIPDESRGKTWFTALTDQTKSDDVPSVLCTDKTVDKERVRYIAVVPDSSNRFPRARKGEVGLAEGWAIARYVREAIENDEEGKRRAIVAIVDVPSQAYGFNEELLGLHQAGAAAVDAYVEARQAGHPVITLIVGNAISGGFLTHGLQSNHLLALNDEGVNVHVMSKQSAARITRRSIEELEKATKQTPAMAYDVESFATLGALHELIDGVDADHPGSEDIEKIEDRIIEAIRSARSEPFDLSNRLQSLQARENRSASIKVRERLTELW
ncbi:biotin-independent malonate decarboxylase subunit beta [Halobacillus shinanisalinarum]|uniref:Biotin-independent malonate decarboxylase subunit beta n=1 Tax=Halobacillus shinanisalinarum TaxID=2932258 RepID=A0ABY4GWI1_9BACI|nr:biotin-independent malonate decarboxylase subunit beta [Halobacillus shinanisalinarum]UOQ92316.1 biotin-independent malonate decarboxylase subunit beta [Halobacillus shinanisalinarum]